MEILKYVIPALIVFFTSTIITWLFFKNEEKKRAQDIRFKNQEQITPLRLQAYERLVLLMERLSPTNLVVRVQSPGMNVRQLQNELLSTIRKEFDHNIAQQVYVSPELWKKIVEAKENLVREINTSVIELKPEAPAIELIKAILGTQIEGDVKSMTYAIERLKKEVRLLF